MAQYIDPMGSNPVMGAGTDAASATASAMVQPRAGAIGRSWQGVSSWGNTYSGGRFFHVAGMPIPLFGMGASTHRGAQTILRQGYDEGIGVERGMSRLGTNLMEYYGPGGGSPLNDFKNRPFATAAAWANRETYGPRTMVTRFPKSFNRFDSTNIFNREHENLYWNPWQASTGLNLAGKKLLPFATHGEDIFSPGASSMMSAASSMFRNSAEDLSGVASTIGYSNPTYSNFLKMRVPGTPGFDMSEGNNAAYALLGADNGLISGRAAGMFAGAKAGLSGEAVPDAVMMASRLSAGGQGFANAATWASGVGSGVNEAGGVLSYARSAAASEGIMGGMSAGLSGSAVKGVSMLGDALPVIGTAATAIQAGVAGFGIAKLITKPLQAGIRFAGDAMSSAKGSIQKPVFGMGFKPTEATLTARQRGVQAIQNSQLNARSWLGSEASSMWGHFQ